ncbi:MAG: FecR domain-containing protein [Prolixibacteraceae bacterium]
MKEKAEKESLILNYLNGICSEEDIQELKFWIEESPENKKEYLEIKDVWDLSRNTNTDTEIQLAYFYKNQLGKIRKSRMRWIRNSSSVAAVLLIGLVISVLTPEIKLKQPENYQVFSVPLGSRSKVMLADGTEVSLNSGSELKYLSSYSAKNREVFLSGEAYFQVKSDKQHPFVVKTSDFDIQVTGTKFNVCAYSDNNITNATLAEGKIQIQIKGTAQIFDINPGEKFKLNRTTREYVQDNVDLESEIAWKDGEFIFRKIPFPELVQRLERWYDVKLNFEDAELQNFAFTGKFKNQETIWQVLDALKLTSPIDYRKTTFREFTIIYKPLNQN